MPQLFHVCSHIKNSSRSRLANLSIPQTKLNLSVARILYEQGFISSVARGDIHGPDAEYVPTTNINIARRRYWLGLKYRDNHPVLSNISVISKPSRKVTATADMLRSLIAGKRQGLVKPLLPGEIMVVATCFGVLEANEAVKRNVGGQLLCRAR